MPISRVTSIKDIVPASNLLPSSDKWAKNIVNKLFSGIESGRLVLSDDESTMEFGESSSHANLTAQIKIHNNATYSNMISGGVIGAAEAYIQGMWSTPDLVNVIRVMVRNIHVLQMMNNKQTPFKSAFLKAYRLLHTNNLTGSKRNISAHYDLGNTFFRLFLDETMMYSSAIYPSATSTLEEAAVHKLDVICQKLNLSENDHVVEIGTGWGGFACHAAEHYGCKVTTTTISQEQYDEACARVKRLNLEDKVTVLFKDYRELTGSYDKLVSIEMIEAVGHEYFKDYFSKCASLLKPDGQMLIQSILMNDQRYEQAKSSVDFIKRYIFPGGCLPSNHEICKNVQQHTDLQLMDIHDITYDYAKTLADWNHRFQNKLDEVKQQGFSEEFIRMWEFYLCYCQGGFMERSIHTSQFVFAKPQWRDPRYPAAIPQQ